MQVPVLVPSTVSEVLEYGVIGLEMSRFTGLYVAIKVRNLKPDQERQSLDS